MSQIESQKGILASLQPGDGLFRVVDDRKLSRLADEDISVGSGLIARESVNPVLTPEIFRKAIESRQGVPLRTISRDGRILIAENKLVFMFGSDLALLLSASPDEIETAVSERRMIDNGQFNMTVTKHLFGLLLDGHEYAVNFLFREPVINSPLAVASRTQLLIFLQKNRERAANPL